MLNFMKNEFCLLHPNKKQNNCVIVLVPVLNNSQKVLVSIPIESYYFSFIIMAFQ